MKALLLADIQHDFLRGGSLAVPDGNAIVPLVNALQPHVDLVIAIQDWHPADHKSFASRHPGRKCYDTIDLHGLSQILWPDHCVQGSLGADFSAELHLNRVEAIIRKGTNPEVDSYSAFFDNAHRRSTGLTGYLRERQVTEVYLAGLAGDYCVYYSALDSLQAGFATYFIEDATRPINPAAFAQCLRQIQARGGHVVQSASLLTPAPGMPV
ncbi:MAG TPA: bifunctional nicotinamidase/pyrazinamidase [Chitinophagaceae bacterium]|nr:bifunctional nicotinamidase/pyrazinamidase [Chitinophagaceae bacterium]